LRVSLRKVKVMSLAFISTIALGACGSSSSTGGTNLAADQTLRFPIDGEIGTFDPAEINAETDVVLYQNLFEGLLKLDDSLKVVPDIATEVPTQSNGGISADGTTYTFHMRKDATFSNGDKITSKDVLYSWNRDAADLNAYGSDFDHVVGYDKLTAKGSTVTAMSGLTAPDDYTVKAQLVSQWPVFLTEVAFQPAAVVISKKSVDKNKDAWWGTPGDEISSGPYVLSARTPGQSLEFKAVSNFWGSPKPTVKTIKIDIVKDLSSAITKYKQGGYDSVGFGGMNSDMNPDDLNVLKADSQYSSQLKFIPKTRTVYIAFDFKGPSPFTGLTGKGHDLRLALSQAIDRKQMADLACSHGIICQPATGGVIAKGLKGYQGDNSDPTVVFDATKAKAMWAAAGGNSIKNLTYVTDTNKVVYKNTAENLIAQWKQNLGITVTEQVVDHSPFIKLYTGHQVRGPHREGWQADYDHPQDWFDNLFVTGASSNGSSYSNPVVDQLAKKADAEPLDTAIPDYQKALVQMETDVAVAPLVYTSGAILFKPYLQGIGANPFNDYYWSEIQILSH
jgi:oligopeptide transport system substrate-binding protein